MPPVYGLDATDLAEWNSQIRDVAFRIVDSFGSDGGDDVEAAATDVIKKDCPKPLAVAETSSREEQTSFHCLLCDKVTVGQRSWQEHLKSNRHRKLVKQQTQAAAAAAASGDDGDDDDQSINRRKFRSKKKKEKSEGTNCKTTESSTTDSSALTHRDSSFIE